MKHLLLGLCMAGALTSCQNKEKPTLPEAPSKKAVSFIGAASWLEGRWENRSPEGDLSEIWKRENDSLMKGEAYFVTGKDTVFGEHVDLLQRNGELFYIVTTRGQNGEQPVEFKRTSGTETQMIFENPQHDYPTKIVYERVAEDSLVATISGVEEGKPKSERFSMKRAR